jgi:molybdopterin-containing oxidoreductase family iron-sulfur binding subunit
MVIDTRRCNEREGCTACIDACHKLHNVPQFGERRHEIKWIWKEPYKHAFPTKFEGVHGDHGDVVRPAQWLEERPALVLCNHCGNPPCVRVCPTQATWKRDDGLVMMDMHRCIGCRFCVVACPYGSRSFNWKDPREAIAEINPGFPTRCKGVVEKCNFCAERLAKGLPPACVETCEKQANGSMVFGDLADKHSPVAELLATAHTIRRKPGLGTQPHVFYIV